MIDLSTLVLVLLLPLLGVAMVLVFVRLLRGPHLLDRVMALDFMAVVVVAILGVYGVATQQQLYLDVAMVVALLSFLGTIGFTFYVERYIGHEDDRDSDSGEVQQVSRRMDEQGAV